MSNKGDKHGEPTSTPRAGGRKESDESPSGRARLGLNEILESIARGDAYGEIIAPSGARLLLVAEAGRVARPARTQRLSRQEIAILRLVELGVSRPDIAAELDISLSTVDKHLAAVRRLYGLHNTDLTAQEARARGDLI